MSSQPKNKLRRDVLLAPVLRKCGFSLHDDQLTARYVCLEIVHTKRALMDPEACVFCGQIRRLTLEKQLPFVERVLRQTIFEPVKELLVNVPASNWPDHMELIDGVELFEGASKLQLELATQHDGNDVVDIDLEMHGLSKD